MKKRKGQLSQQCTCCHGAILASVQNPNIKTHMAITIYAGVGTQSNCNS